MNQAEVQAEAIVKEVTARLDHITRIVGDLEPRLACASDEGATLASEVREFLNDPDAVGTDRLYAAYQQFMQAHSGNFHVGPGVVNAALSSS